MKNNKLLKAVIPVLMVLIVGGIWFMQQKPLEEKPDNSISSETDEGDFTLSVSSIDLEALKEHKLPIIIDFGADSCAPCKAMAPVLVTLNEEMQEKAIIKFVDVWKYGEASRDFPVQVIPTQVIINADGSPYVPSDELANTIPFTMYSDRKTEEHVFTVHQGGLTEEEMRAILKDMGVE